jgi:hypothetical protein
MTQKRNSVIRKEWLYDFSVDGAISGAFQLRPCDPNGNPLPAGFIVRNAGAKVEEAITPSASRTMTFGTETDPDGFLADIIAAYNAAGSVVRSGEVAGALLWDDTNDHEIDHLIGATTALQNIFAEIGTGVLTGGKVRFFVEGYVPSESPSYPV